MSPDRRRPNKKPRASSPKPAAQPVTPSADDPFKIVYFRRHIDDDPTQSAPGREFLDGCPQKVRTLMRNILVEVARSKPGQFVGGGYWEAMHDKMTGYYEVRVDGSDRPKTHYRLFCRLDSQVDGEQGLLVVVTGMSKRIRTTFADRDYSRVRALGTEYLARMPRSVC
jgi:hypothetical protein